MTRTLEKPNIIPAAAVEVAPENANALAKLVKGLRLAGRGDEARSALQAALFRNPRNPRFRKLWNEYQ